MKGDKILIYSELRQENWLWVLPPLSKLSLTPEPSPSMGGALGSSLMDNGGVKSPSVAQFSWKAAPAFLHLFPGVALPTAAPVAPALSRAC